MMLFYIHTESRVLKYLWCRFNSFQTLIPTDLQSPISWLSQAPPHLLPLLSLFLQYIFQPISIRCLSDCYVFLIKQFSSAWSSTCSLVHHFLSLSFFVCLLVFLTSISLVSEVCFWVFTSLKKERQTLLKTVLLFHANKSPHYSIKTRITTN